MYLQEERANSLARTNHLSTFLLQSSTLMNSPNFLLLSPPGCPHQHVVVGSSDNARSRLPALYLPAVGEPGQGECSPHLLLQTRLKLSLRSFVFFCDEEDVYTLHSLRFFHYWQLPDLD